MTPSSPGTIDVTPDLANVRSHRYDISICASSIFDDAVDVAPACVALAVLVESHARNDGKYGDAVLTPRMIAELCVIMNIGGSAQFPWSLADCVRALRFAFSSEGNAWDGSTGDSLSAWIAGYGLEPYVGGSFDAVSLPFTTHALKWALASDLLVAAGIGITHNWDQAQALGSHVKIIESVHEVRTQGTCIVVVGFRDDMDTLEFVYCDGPSNRIGVTGVIPTSEVIGISARNELIAVTSI